MAFITKDTDYAMRALVHLALHPGRTLDARELSKRLDISHSYLRKLLQKLGRAGMLVSAKGKNGGSALKKRPEDVFLKDLVKLFQGNIDIAHCKVKTEPCPNVKTCLLHKRLRALEASFKREIERLSIKALIEAKV